MAITHLGTICTLMACGMLLITNATSRLSDTTHIPYSIYIQGGLTNAIASNVYCLDDVACPPFESGLGSSVDLMVATRFALADNLFLTAGMGGGLWTTTMRSTDAAGRTRDAQGDVVPFVREQTLYARSTYISAGANIGYTIGDMRFSLGPRIELGIGSPTWQQTSRIISPSNIVYPDGSSQIVSVSQQAIPDANALRMSAMLVAEYIIAISPAASIAPYLAVSYSPFSVRNGADWTDARGSIGVAFHSTVDYITAERPKPVEPVLMNEPEPFDLPSLVATAPLDKLDTIEEQPVASAQPVILVRREGSTSNDITVRITTQEQSQTFSVLPFVFFDSASASIPARYKLPRSINDFDATSAASDQHSMYLEILNVIGSRLRSSTDTIVVHGYADSSSERGSCDLARRRAESVRDYLTMVWGIAPGRVAIAAVQGTCTPFNASPSSHSEGRAENRRVEVLTPNFELFLPVIRREMTVIVDSDLDSLKVSVDTPSDTVNRWVTRLCQDEEVIYERQHGSNKSSTAFSVPAHILSKLHSVRSIQLQIVGYTTRGDTLKRTVPIDIVLRKENQRLRTLALAMFEFKQSALTPRDSVLLKEFARQLIVGDHVRINGYTDQLGNPRFNDALSKNRASAVADRLRRERPDCDITEVVGHGARRFPRGVDSYALPEQRFMSRTVQLEVTGRE